MFFQIALAVKDLMYQIDVSDSNRFEDLHSFLGRLSLGFLLFKKYPSKGSLSKHICSWHDKLIILWTLVRPAKTFLPIENNLFIFFFFGIFVTFVTLLSPNFRKVIY